MAKATATCTCATCGCTFYKYAVKYNRRDADSWEEWAAEYYNECDDCYEARIKREREEANKEAAEVAAANNWPKLVGTEKQITWAESIRAAIIGKGDELIQNNSHIIATCVDDPERAERAQRVQNDIDLIQSGIDYLLTNTSASWWIDNRNSYDLVRQTARDIRNGKIFIIPETPEETPEEAQTEKEAEEEMILRPEQQRYEGVAEIKVGSESVSAKFKKSNTFMAIVKSLGYTWNPNAYCWKKEITITTGTAQDRAAELGSKLLNAGFAVSIHDAEIRQAAVESKYEPECFRWVLKNKATGDFMIRWNSEKDFYTEAKRIPKAKWQKPNMIVPAVEYKSVMEFAQTYGFKLTPGAHEIMDEMEAKTKVVSPASVKAPQYDEHPLSDVLNSSREVLDDLKDE